MAIYSRADRTSNVTSAAACFEIRTTSTDRPKIMEIGISLVTAAATVIGIGRPQAIGITPTTPLIVQAEDTGDPAGTIVTAMAWGTAPTVPLQFFRRWAFPGTIGAGVIFTFPRGLVIPISSSLVFWNILGGATLDVHVVIDE
jgi:hypothetical protein